MIVLRKVDQGSATLNFAMEIDDQASATLNLGTKVDDLSGLLH